LSSDAARLFRMLGLLPGPDFSLAAAASLAGVPFGQARTLLAELDRAHLLTEHGPGRYSFHDLLRAYAAEEAHTHEDDDARRAARLGPHHIPGPEGTLAGSEGGQRRSPGRGPAPRRPGRPGHGLPRARARLSGTQAVR